MEPAVVVATSDGPVILFQREDNEAGTWQALAQSLATGEERTVLQTTFEPATTFVALVEAGSTTNAELPPGWFLLVRNANAAPAPYPDFSAASVNGGEVPLPIITPLRPGA